MKIFIAGARSINSLPLVVKQKLKSICDKNYEILIGDCYGVDSAVQKELIMLEYKNVVVYASNGLVRNNIGHWTVNSVIVSEQYKGFDFYKQKDIAMANDADYGFMIWDGESKGTLNNMINMLVLNKKVLVYYAPQSRLVQLKNLSELSQLITYCSKKTSHVYSKLLASFSEQLVLY